MSFGSYLNHINLLHGKKSVIDSPLQNALLSHSHKILASSNTWSLYHRRHPPVPCTQSADPSPAPSPTLLLPNCPWLVHQGRYGPNAHHSWRICIQSFHPTHVPSILDWRLWSSKMMANRFQNRTWQTRRKEESCSWRKDTSRWNFCS